MVSNVPNMFIINGPQSNSAVFVPVRLAEFQVRWVGDVIQALGAKHIGSLEPTPEVEQEWRERVKFIAEQTLMPRADSWYMGANIPGKPRESLYWLGGINEYLRRSAHVLESNFDEFVVREEEADRVDFTD